VVQSDIAITKARTSPNDNSGAVGVDVSVGDGVEETVGLWVIVGEEVAELDEDTCAEDELGEGKFANALNESFGFPPLSKRPKLESGLSV
jgi:hypothetical protein